MRWKSKEEKYRGWSEWFAWYPVQVNGEMVWFEKIYRRIVRSNMASLNSKRKVYTWLYTDFKSLLADAGKTENEAYDSQYVSAASGNSYVSSNAATANKIKQILNEKKTHV